MNAQKHWFPLVAALTFTLACSNGPDPVAPANTTETVDSMDATASTPDVQTDLVEAPVAHASAAAATDAVAQGGLLGPVTETMDSGGYTYVLIDTVNGPVWVAGPPTPIEIGQVVHITDSHAMQDFTSSTLDRTFDEIHFCSAITQSDVSGDSAKSHMEAAAAPVGTVKVAKVDGGQTVEEAITGKNKFVGNEIMIRGQVVKFSADIMGKNWIHLRDGSGSEGTNDLTITTDAVAAVGDIVLVKGTLTADKDFGFGYKYDLIVEDADVTVE